MYYLNIYKTLDVSEQICKDPEKYLAIEKEVLNYVRKTPRNERGEKSTALGEIFARQTLNPSISVPASLSSGLLI